MSISIKQARVERKKQDIKQLLGHVDALQELAKFTLINRLCWKNGDVTHECFNAQLHPSASLAVENQARALARTLLEIIDEETGMDEKEAREFVAE